MRIKAIALVSIVLFAAVAYGQPALDRVLHFAPSDSAQDMQGIATLIRSIVAMPQAIADPAQKTLALHGVAGQLDLAEWLLNDLDKPASAGTHEYKLSVAGDDVVHVFYLTHIETAQQLGEVATAVRSTADIRRLYVYSAPKAVVVRGTAGEIDLAGWLFGKMDQPANGQSTAGNEYKVPGGGDDVVRVFYLAHTGTVPEFTELVVLIRTMTGSKRAYSYNTPRALAIRGTADQLALAEWLCNELDQPAGGQNTDAAPRDYRSPGSSDDVVRVFYLTRTKTVADFQKLVTEVRTASRVRRVYTYNSLRAVAVRGTANEIALANQMIGERYR